MRFDYSVYYFYNCHRPLVDFSFEILMLVGGVVYLIKNKPDTLAKIIIAIVVLLGVGLSLVDPTRILLRGGVFLLSEKEADQVQIEGTVDELIICNSETGVQYFRADKYEDCGYGGAIVINGEKYYLVTCGDTKVGDYVYLSVLPKSHFVMEIRNTPD